jgi:flavodoxin
MKTLIICASYHHLNTMKVAQAMRDVLKATVLLPAEFNPLSLPDYDLIGFGSGIYNQTFHSDLLELIPLLPQQKGKRAFVFSTNTFGLKMYNDKLRPSLTQKGFSVVGDFTCKGYIDYSFIKWFFGGMSKGHPDETDLQNAREFARALLLLPG